MTVCIYDKNKIKDISTIVGTEINTRSRFVKFNIEGTEFEVGTLHLASGEAHQERKDELDKLFSS